MTTQYEDMLHYRFRPRPVGGEMVLSLADDALEVGGGNKTIRLLYSDITSVQIVYRPTSIFTKKYVVLVRDKRGARLKFNNVTYRGLAETVLQNTSFDPFVEAFLLKLKPFSKNITMLQGEKPWRYYGICALSIVMLFLGVKVISNALSTQPIWATVAYTGMFFYVTAILFMWLKLNKPNLRL